MRRTAAGLLLLALLVAPADAGAHAALARTDPAAGANLPAGPAGVRITVNEAIEPSLSTIRVTGEDGREYQTGTPALSPDDTKTLQVALDPLPQGVYIVRWRMLSAVDGHVTAGSYAFGVRASTAGVDVSDLDTDPQRLEVLARWLLLVGLVLLVGAATAAVARFGGRTVALAGAGWIVAVAGLLLFAEAQRRATGASLGDLLDTEVGTDLKTRSAALLASGLAVLVAWRVPRRAREALGVAGIAGVAAIALHVAAGHAATTELPNTIAVLAQTAHFAAAGVWFGGLAALLLGVRGAPSEAKARAVRRFSGAAAVALGVVVVTGTLRAIDELGAVEDLVDTGYGRAILAKIVVLGAIAAIALRNRRDSVPAATTDLAPLRRRSQVELGLAAIALATAALLTSLAPPLASQAEAAKPAIELMGVDGGETVRVKLTVASRDPGPNRFTVDIDDHDAGDDVKPRRVRLAFTPIDDPGEKTTTLTLAKDGERSYSGTGANLRFDGRWRITVLVESLTGSAEVRFDIQTSEPHHDLAVTEEFGKAPYYTLLIAPYGYLRLTAFPPQAGPTRLTVQGLTVLEGEQRLKSAVMTVATGGGPTERQDLRRVSPSEFAAEAEVAPGPTTVVVVARTPNGTRLRGLFRLRLSGG